jgi:hypothetical protein
VREFDELRIPSPLDPSAIAYKDWLHLNLFDHRSGTIGLINVSLHGSPADPRSRAVGTSLFHSAGGTWLGNVEIMAVSAASVSAAGVSLPEVALLLDPGRETLHASVEQPAKGLRARLSASLASQPAAMDLAQPFGSGWIDWYVAPRVRLTGSLSMDGRSHDLSQWSGYHDHNWGRWRWGDDIGWEWGVFVSAEPAMTIIFCRVSNRLHDSFGPAQLMLVGEQRTRTFRGSAVSIRPQGLAKPPLRRLPGALAALHSDRREPELPDRLRIEAAAGLDWLRLEFETVSAAQLIEGETVQPGYSFIHELAGRFTVEGNIRGSAVECTGLGVFEHVG